MDDAGAGRHHLEVVEGALPPAQELVALAVALVLDLDVALEGVGAAEQVGDDGVVDDQVRRRQRIDLLRVAAEVADRLAHGGQVDDARHAGEVLHDHPGRGELDLDARLGRGIPVGDGLDVVFGDVRAVFGAQQVLGEHLEAVGELLGAGHRIEAVDLVAVVADLQGVARLEGIRDEFTESLLLTSTPGVGGRSSTGCADIRLDTNSTVVLLSGRSASGTGGGPVVQSCLTRRVVPPPGRGSRYRLGS